MNTGTVILTLVGLGIIAALAAVLIELRYRPSATPAVAAPTQVIVERRPYGLGPYYAHLPYRPLVY
jgi:hypothetical protein